MIPECWANETENYITNPVLIDFCTKNRIKAQYIRADLLKAINEYAKENPENKKKVEDWLEIVLKQGMKNILFRKIEFDIEPTSDILKKAFKNCRNQKLYSNITEGNGLNIQSIKYNNRKIEFVFTILLYEVKKEVKNKIIYPIFVDIDLDKKIIFGRAKSKTNLFRLNSKDENEIGNNTSTDNLIIEAIELIEENLNAKKINKEEYIESVKKSIYNILEKYTFTPECIENQILEMDSYLDSFINNTLDMLQINNPINFEKAKEDMKIFVEKYISINTEDKDIFINDREAYPYKLIATDSEMTKVEETTTSYEPLQCKEKFFDNKKSIKYEGTCDGIFLMCARKQKGNFSSNTYRAKISIKRKFCCVRFEAYVMEEDINNVLSNIINS
ncbi:MAG TPA: hypothetical protein OIM48_05470 [Clostridiaceae bacterium]|nr:hypothetical protein [Clostridiaceae bacterium]